MRTGPYRILVVEDNPGDLRLIQEALRQYGIDHEITHYATGDSAIRAIKDCGSDGRNVPDLILLDYNLPRGDGRDLLLAACDNPALATIPKAVVTSSMAMEDREQAMQLGAKCFIVKPADLDAFLTQVGTAIAGLLETNAGLSTGAAAPS